MLWPKPTVQLEKGEERDCAGKILDSCRFPTALIVTDAFIKVSEKLDVDLKTNNIVLLYGPSGIGKTSFSLLYGYDAFIRNEDIGKVYFFICDVSHRLIKDQGRRKFLFRRLKKQFEEFVGKVEIQEGKFTLVIVDQLLITMLSEKDDSESFLNHLFQFVNIHRLIFIRLLIVSSGHHVPSPASTQYLATNSILPKFVTFMVSKADVEQMAHIPTTNNIDKYAVLFSTMAKDADIVLNQRGIDCNWVEHPEIVKSLVEFSVNIILDLLPPFTKELDVTYVLKNLLQDKDLAYSTVSSLLLRLCNTRLVKLEENKKPVTIAADRNEQCFIYENLPANYYVKFYLTPSAKLILFNALLQFNFNEKCLAQFRTNARSAVLSGKNFEALCGLNILTFGPACQPVEPELVEQKYYEVHLHDIKRLWNPPLIPIYLVKQELWDLVCPLEPTKSPHQAIFMAHCDSVKPNYRGYDFWISHESHICVEEKCKRTILKLDVIQVSTEKADRSPEKMEEQLREILLKMLNAENFVVNADTEVEVTYIAPAEREADVKPFKVKQIIEWRQNVKRNTYGKVKVTDSGKIDLDVVIKYFQSTTLNSRMW